MVEHKFIKDMVDQCTNNFTGLNSLTSEQIKQLTLSLHPLISNKVYEETIKHRNLLHLDILYRLAKLDRPDYDKVVKLLDYTLIL